MLRALAVLMLSIFCGSFAHAQENRFGLGFILGDPTGLSVRYYQDDEHSYDAQLAGLGSNYMLLWGDMDFHFPDLIKEQHPILERLSPYVGVGPVIAISTKDDHEKGQYFDDRDNDFAIGVRVPFGVEWIWDRVPIGVGVEVTPGIMVLPATHSLLMGGLTLRYYF